jgi:transcriptional regulator with XRE-family HTH domain
MIAEDNESALRKELGRTLRTARLMAGFLQRELAQKIGYSRSRVAGAEAGDYVSQQFCERCDKVLGTKLTQGYDVIRKLRIERLFTALGANPGDSEPGESWERCGALAETRRLPVPGYDEVQERPAAGQEERLSVPSPLSEDPRVKVVVGIISGVWHIEIHLPDSGPEAGRCQYLGGTEGDQ